MATVRIEVSEGAEATVNVERSLNETYISITDRATERIEQDSPPPPPVAPIPPPARKARPRKRRR